MQTTEDKIKAYVALTYIQELGIVNKEIEKQLQMILTDGQEKDNG